MVTGSFLFEELSMIKIAHEAPLSIFEQVQAVTDYDYCLVNLYDEDQRYRSKFKQAIAKGREVYIDNAIFEVGTAFEADAFANHVVDIFF